MKKIQFNHEGTILEVDAIRFNDAFYEIKNGLHKGSLVHVFDIINFNKLV